MFKGIDEVQFLTKHDHHPFCHPSLGTRTILVAPSLKLFLNLSLKTESICNSGNWKSLPWSFSSTEGGRSCGSVRLGASQVHSVLGFLFWSRFQCQEWKPTAWAGATLHPCFLGRSNTGYMTKSGFTPLFSSQKGTGKILLENWPCGWTSNIVEFASLAVQQK